MTPTGCAARAAALACILLAGPAAAEGTPVAYVAQGEALFGFDVPDGWIMRSGVDVESSAMPAGAVPAPRVISMMPGDGDGAMWAGLWSPPGVATLEDADAYVERLAPTMITAWSAFSEEDARVNGAAARIHRGEGTRGGRNVVGQFAAIALDGGRIAVAAFIGTPEARSANDAALTRTLNSIAAAEGRAR
jgi:hypothetical protein